MLRLTAGHLSFGWVAAVSACKHREAALTWLSAPQHHTDENSWCVSVSVCKTPRGYWGSHTHAHTHIPHPPTDTTTTRTFPVIPITEWHYKLSRRVREGGGQKGQITPFKHAHGDKCPLDSELCLLTVLFVHNINYFQNMLLCNKQKGNQVATGQLTATNWFPLGLLTMQIKPFLS